MGLEGLKQPQRANEDTELVVYRMGDGSGRRWGENSQRFHKSIFKVVGIYYMPHTILGATDKVSGGCLYSQEAHGKGEDTHRIYSVTNNPTVRKQFTSKKCPVVFF